jgi:predicted nucleic acid-binding protein
MIAADTSSLSAYFKGDTGPDVNQIEVALQSGDLVLPPVVLTELLSDPASRSTLEPIIADFELLEATPGYWERAGKTRGQILAHGLKAKITDALIVQSCIDHDVALITHDGHFRHFAKYCGLKLERR